VNRFMRVVVAASSMMSKLLGEWEWSSRSTVDRHYYDVVWVGWLVIGP